MPALVNMSVGSLRGTSGPEGTTSWPCLRKNSRKLERISFKPDIADCYLSAGLFAAAFAGNVVFASPCPNCLQGAAAGAMLEARPSWHRTAMAPGQAKAPSRGVEGASSVWGAHLSGPRGVWGGTDSADSVGYRCRSLFGGVGTAIIFPAGSIGDFRRDQTGILPDLALDLLGHLGMLLQKVLRILPTLAD